MSESEPTPDATAPVESPSTPVVVADRPVAPDQDAAAPTAPADAPPPPTAPPVDTVPPVVDAAPPATGLTPPPTTPVDDAATSTPEPKKRSAVGPLVAALAVGALVGGVSGAGVAAWSISSTATTTTGAAASPQTITVNSPDDVNVVNAVAVKVAPSVVTIDVASSSAAGSGSGVVLTSDGYVLTNTHVVTLGGATAGGSIEVTTSDGSIYSAEIVGLDPVVDLAVIKLQGASGLTPIEWGDSDALDVGDLAVVVGAPLGLSNSVTDGIVSALNRSISIQSSAVPDDGTDSGESDSPFQFDLPEGTTAATGTISVPVIQTDASINPGNSGGALVDENGSLVGIVVAIATTGSTTTSDQSGSIGLGFAIPSSLAQRVAQELIETGSASHGLLGATVRDATSDDGDTVGSVLMEIVPGGAAAAAGLQAGDIVTSVGGVPITDRVDLTAQVRNLAAGTEVELTYIRDGETNTAQVTLGELDL